MATAALRNKHTFSDYIDVWLSLTADSISLDIKSSYSDGVMIWWSSPPKEGTRPKQLLRLTYDIRTRTPSEIRAFAWSWFATNQTTAGFGWGPVTNREFTHYAVLVPHGFLGFIFVILPLYHLTIWFLNWLERRELAIVSECPSCGYDLTGNETGVCPECGVSIGTEATQA